jgi:hypothetical protein
MALERRPPVADPQSRGDGDLFRSLIAIGPFNPSGQALERSFVSFCLLGLPVRHALALLSAGHADAKRKMFVHQQSVAH